MKKILISLIVCMFIISMLPGIVGDAETNEQTLKARKFIETRDMIPVYTEHGLENVPAIRGNARAPGGGDKSPRVTITNPQNGATVSGIVSITVKVNDREDDPDPTPIIKIDGVQVAQAFSYEWDTGPEANGEHTITATATDSAGNTGSDSNTVTKGGGGEDPVDKYALVIGISDYPGWINDLQYCDDDARDWKSFLAGEGYQVKVLIDRKATASNIEAEIDKLLANEDGNDYIVLTYSGHGSSAYGSSIISYDEWYMSSGWFDSKFSNADSQHIFFTFDACEIGGMQSLIESGRVGAFASNQKSAYDGDSWMRNGVFTYYQMEGWNVYDNFEEDGDYAVNNMESWAANKGYNVDPFTKDMYDGPMMP
jgi:hypothetical protein